MYRENIWDFLNAPEGRVRTLVVPKNTGLKGYAWKLLKEAQLDLEKAVKADETTLRYRDLTVLLRRGEDIPQIVQDRFDIGQPAMGLTGDDLLDEYRRRNPNNNLKVENTYDWFDAEARYLRPALCLLNKTGKPEDVPLMPVVVNVAVNGKYEITAREYLSRSPNMKGRGFAIKTYQGDLEDAVADNSSMCAVDTVYSGKTIKKKGLEVADVIRFSDLVLVSPFRKEGQSKMERMAKYIPRKQRFRT